MTSFPSSDGPSGRLRRDGGGGLPRQGIDRSLAAPGLSVSVGSGGAARLDQIAGLLDAFTGVAGTALQIDAQKAAEEAQTHQRMLQQEAEIAAAQEQHAEAITKQKRGLGERDARAKLPELQSLIESDQIQMPDGADPVVFARTFLSEQFDVGDPEYQDAAVALIENDFVKAIEGRKQTLAKVAVKDSHNLMGEWGVDKTPAQIEETVGQALAYPGAQDLPEQQVRASVVGPAMQVAVQAGDVDRVNELAPLLGDAGLAARYAADAKTNKNQSQAAQKLNAKASLDAVETAGASRHQLAMQADRLRPLLGDSFVNDYLDKLGQKEDAEYKAAVSSAQQSYESGQAALAETGVLTKEAHQSQNLPRTLLDPADPNYLSPEKYRTIDGRIKAAEKESDSDLRVRAALGGVPTILTSEDSGSFTKALRAANAMDGNNRVQNPVGLAAAAAASHFLPGNVVDAVQASLRSSDAAVAGNGIEAAGLLATIDEGFFAKLSAGLPEGDAALVAASAQWARDGLYNTPEGRQKIAAETAVLRQRIADRKEITKEERTRIARTLKEKFDREETAVTVVRDEMTKLFEEERNRVGYTKDPGWIIDLDPDPDLDLTGPGVMETAERAYAEHFAKLSLTLDPQTAAKGAAAFAQGQIREKFEFVRFNGRVFPVPTANVAGGMPDSLRWDAGMEADMKAALEDPRIGLSPDDVSSFMPLTLPTADGNKSGWAIVLPDGTLVRNELGIPLLVTPTPEQERRNIEYRKRNAAIEKSKESRHADFARGVHGFISRLAGE